MFTDHRALVYLYHMQDTSNMLTHWAIALQNFGFTVKHISGKLNIVPDTLSRFFGDANPKLAVNGSALASICRNIPNDRPYHSARPRDFEISTQSLDQLEPVQIDCELFASVVSVVPLMNPEALVKLQKEEFREYFKFLSSPTDSTTAIPAGKTPIA